jgi:hypothetical protein
MPREVITKVNAGCRQLETAIWLYFNNGDDVAIHTLACNAREIFERQCERREKPRMFNRISQNHSEIVSTELWNVLNAARNFFKHLNPKEDVDASIEFNPDDNKMTIYIASHDCASLLEDAVPITVKRYLLWLSATEPGLVTGFTDPTGTIPGIHDWSDEKQHEFGRMYVC